MRSGKPVRISSIDIGTNTVLLLIADVGRDGTITPIAHGHEIVRLGKGVDRTKNISAESIDRLRTVLTQYVAISRKHHVERIAACATSAVREAENREALRDLVRKEFGIELIVLSGREEAALTYLGAVSDFPGAEHYTVMDIGGGSTEVTSGTGTNIRTSISVPLGCVRLTEQFLTSAPPSRETLERVRNVILRELEPVRGFSDESTLVGVAGTVTTLAALDLQLSEYDSLKVSGHRLSIRVIDEVFALLSQKTVDEIRHIPQIHPERADILLAGVLILREVMKTFGWREITASDRGLRYGLAMREAGE